MDDEPGNTTYIDRLLVSSALSLVTLIFTLVGNGHMFSGYLGQIEADSQPVCTSIVLCTRVARSVLPIFKSL